MTFISTVTVVYLIYHLISSHNQLVSIKNNDIVSAISLLTIIRLMFSHKFFCDLNSQSSKCFSLCIDYPSTSICLYLIWVYPNSLLNIRGCITHGTIKYYKSKLRIIVYVLVLSEHYHQLYFTTSKFERIKRVFLLHSALEALCL